MKWYKFDPTKGSRQKRPPIYEAVLLFATHQDTQRFGHCIGVGYRKNHAGDKQAPYFIHHGQALDKVLGWAFLTSTKGLPIDKIYADARKQILGEE